MVDSAIMAASGLPGSPMMNLPSGSSASTAGWPGRMAMPSISSRPPSSATERRRWSVPDRPVPPVVMTTSAGSSSAAGRPEGCAARHSRRTPSAGSVSSSAASHSA